MLRREESGCFLLAYGIIKDLVYLVYSKNALLVSLLGCYPILIDSLSCSRNFDIDEFGRGGRRIGEKKKEEQGDKAKEGGCQACTNCVYSEAVSDIDDFI